MFPELTRKIPHLLERARMLKAARAFFEERGVIEADVGAIVKNPPNDANIDVISADDHYLHTSPEYALKRLLSAGFPDCYYLGHVYRRAEVGSRHNPEFTMAEWYRKNISFEAMIRETADFLALFFGPLPLETISYHDAFLKYAKIDLETDPLDSRWDRQTTIHYHLTHDVEPHLGKNGLTALIDFPPHEAALACTTTKNHKLVAERFEIYHRGVELANGYHELSDPIELKKRFEAINATRTTPYTPDPKLLAALPHLPPCCGVALGFDRALMLKLNQTIQTVIPFSWEEL